MGCFHSRIRFAFADHRQTFHQLDLTRLMGRKNAFHHMLDCESRLKFPQCL